LKLIQAASLLALETVTIGAGGNGGFNTPTDGSTGGTTSFGAHCSATGGGGGSRHLSYAGSSSTSAYGGSGSGGDVNFMGGPGFPAGYSYGSAAFALPGGNGALPIGGGGAPGIQSATSSYLSSGAPAQNNSGGGGSGGAPRYNDTGSKMSAGDGGSGKCVVWEFG